MKTFLNGPKKPQILSGRTDKDGNYEYLRQQALKKISL